MVWEHNLGGGSPEEGVYRGRDSVMALFERILEPWEYLRAEPREIRSRGGGAFDVRGDLHAKHSLSATEMISPYVQHFQVRDGLLVKGEMFTGDIECYSNDIDAVFEDWHTEDERYLDAGDGEVVLAYRIVGRGKGSGVPVDRELAILWTVRDGKVLGGKVYHDPEEALEAAGDTSGARVE